uniref:Uncharacterized protein n=1 Tax=Ananas comosus var. bracteatus TaxID=296719 RepID=A0A6V7QVD1_ANACO
MGCAGSKESRRRDLGRSLSPLRRSLSAETHVVALTSSTLGSLKLDASVEGTGGEESVGERNAAGLVKAKAWTVRTPTETPRTSPRASTLRRTSVIHLPKSPRGALPATPLPPPPLSPQPRSNHPKQQRHQHRAVHKERTDREGGAVLHEPSRRPQDVRGLLLREDDTQGLRRARGREGRVHARGFKEELRRTLGGCHLPSLFARGRYVGGAEEVKQMHESGELGAVLEGCERAAAAAAAEEEEEGESNRGGPCEGCGDVRFVLCGRCSGSCKVYAEDEEEEEEEEGEEEEAINGGFRRCPECNENGIVRCPVCC